MAYHSISFCTSGFHIDAFCYDFRKIHLRRNGDAMLTLRSILRIATPPYLFQPLQVVKRLRLEYLWRTTSEVSVVLPWGLPIAIDPHESLGYCVASQGLYELGVTETLWRLTEPGDLAIDVGANIGYMSSVLAVRVGPSGKVICFEPHPEIFASLRKNTENWKKDHRCGTFDLRQAALGKETGNAKLHMRECFLTNRGTARISDEDGRKELSGIDISVQNLDQALERSAVVGVLKLDVELYELSVLQGAREFLKRHAVRDVVFEELTPYPAPTHEYLKSLGYSVFGIAESFSGVRLLPNAQSPCDPVCGSSPNYLATVNPGRAVRRLTSPIWRSFGLGRLLPDR
jgi:FkbM family methyltransferase